MGSNTRNPRIWLYLISFGALVACNGFSSSDSGSPAVDVGPAVVSPEAGAPDAAVTPEADAAATPDAAPGCTTVLGKLDADTELAACNSGKTTGTNVSINVGSNGALFRFSFDGPTAAALATARSTTGTLHLTAEGSGAKAGTIEAHFARNDWEEGTTMTFPDGADECRRQTTTGFGWGPGDVGWSKDTLIKSGVDYDSASSSVLFADGTNGATLAIAGLMPTSISSDGKVSFFVTINGSGSIVVVTKEFAGGAAAATLSLTYCN